MLEDEMIFETDHIDFVEKKEELGPTNSMVAYVEERFSRAEDKRLSDEQRWIMSYRNYRGAYGPDTMFTEAEKSRVFVKVTKTKVQAAYGQVIEVLFGNNTFPLTVEHTKLPEGIAESVHLDPMAPPTPPSTPEGPQGSPFGTRDGPPLPPGATQHDLLNLGPLEQQLEPVRDRIVEGPGTTPTAVTFHPAYVAAKKMEKKIHDQLEESEANKHLRSLAFEMALFGTGVMKGPFLTEKEYPNWGEDGAYAPVIKPMPKLSHVSIWNAYPDPDASNMGECEYFIERYKMSRTDLKNLNKRPFFIKKAIEAACDAGPNYERKYWEHVMEESSAHDSVERFEVLEFWGYCPVELLEEYGVDVSPELRKADQIIANVWICNGEVLRCVLNPFKPARIPYYAVPYELNPYSFFGIGVAENMEDTQILMNGFMRMAVDNAALSGNLLIEVDETNLVAGQDLEVFPGKVFRRQGGAPGQAIFGTQFPNVSQQNMMMFDKARILADESTGLPSYAHGQTGIQGLGRTASGISMLINAANGAIRTVIKNLDDYLIGPIGKAFFAFNMQFDHDPEIKGDLEVVARGTESLMANEVRSQRLMQFLGIVANPVLAPFAKLDVIVREIAKSLDLDPDKVTNSLPDAAVQAEVLKQFMGGMPGVPGASAEGGDPTSPSPNASVPGADAFDTTGSGGGNIGTGSVPLPGEQGFSGN